jgi:transcriptional regulator with XRE-family HTH domain
MHSINEKAAAYAEECREMYSAVRRSDFAMQVRVALARSGLRNVDLAQRLQVSEARISRLLKGGENVALETMYSVADALGEPLSVILGEVQAVETLNEERETLEFDCSKQASNANVFDFPTPRQHKKEYTKSRLLLNDPIGEMSYEQRAVA